MLSENLHKGSRLAGSEEKSILPHKRQAAEKT